MKDKINLNEAIRFHGHLGPYLVLGLLAGECGLRKLRCRKHFGLRVKVWGADKKPKSCLVDGIQLSTGATYGKGNIKKYDGKRIKIDMTNKDNGRVFSVVFNKELTKSLDAAITHKDSEVLAKRLYRTDPSKLFLMRS